MARNPAIWCNLERPCSADPLHKSLFSVNEKDALQPQISCNTSSRIEPSLFGCRLGMVPLHPLSLRLVGASPMHCEKPRFCLAYGFLSCVLPHVKRVYIAHLPHHERTVDVTVRVVDESHSSSILGCAIVFAQVQATTSRSGRSWAL